MKILKVFGILIGGLAGVFLVVGLFLPEDYGMSRSIEVNAPAEVIFEQVNNLKKNEAWSPWKAQDATLKMTYGPTTKGKGATYSWTSENSGAGTLTIEESLPPTKIRNALNFQGQGSGTGIWTFEPKGKTTHVTWAMEGKADGLVGRYFGLFIDGMVGPSFEAGLSSLKKVAEAVPPPKPAVAAEAKPDVDTAPQPAEEPAGG